MSTLAYMTPNTIPSTTTASPLVAAFEQVNKTGEAVVVEQQGQPAVVMLPLEEYESMKETCHIFSSLANIKHLMISLEQLERGEVVVKTIEELTG